MKPPRPHHSHFLSEKCVFCNLHTVGIPYHPGKQNCSLGLLFIGLENWGLKNFFVFCSYSPSRSYSPRLTVRQDCTGMYWLVSAKFPFFHEPSCLNWGKLTNWQCKHRSSVASMHSVVVGAWSVYFKTATFWKFPPQKLFYPPPLDTSEIMGVKTNYFYPLREELKENPV